MLGLSHVAVKTSDVSPSTDDPNCSRDVRGEAERAVEHDGVGVDLVEVGLQLRRRRAVEVGVHGLGAGILRPLRDRQQRRRVRRVDAVVLVDELTADRRHGVGDGVGGVGVARVGVGQHGDLLVPLVDEVLHADVALVGDPVAHR